MQSVCSYRPGHLTSRAEGSHTEKTVQQKLSCCAPDVQRQPSFVNRVAAAQRPAGSTRSRLPLVQQSNLLIRRRPLHWSFDGGVGSDTPSSHRSSRAAPLAGAGRESLGRGRLEECSSTPQRSRTTRASAFSGASSGGAKRGALTITETDKISGELRDSVLTAVERLGGRVTVGDVAAKAGVKVTEAERALKALAADANGYLEVSDEGDVLYVLPKDMRAVLAQNSLRVRMAPLTKKAGEVGSYLLRVSFGTALLVSIAVVYLAIAALLSSSRSDNDNRDRGGYRSSYGGPGFYINLSDIFWYWDPFYYQRVRSQLQKREMSFFESVFSFVFGDGDPNEGLDDVRWKAVGELIASKGGVVAAQEVAPFLDIPSDFEESESYMLPVVQRFDGYPEVDEQGNILYRFPSLQRTAQDWTGRPKVLTGEAAMDPDFTFPGSAPSSSRQQRQSQPLYFAKNLWKFSNAPEFKRALAAGLGVLNLVGVLYLSYLVRDPMLVRQAGSEFVSGVVSFLPWLQAYAAAFFAIPTVRWFAQQKKNENIMVENQRREESAMLLSRPSAPLRRKLLNAREQAEKVIIDQDRVIYTTAQDVADQSLDAKEWERKLEERR